MAKLESYNPAMAANVDLKTEPRGYIANIAGTGFSQGDVIKHIRSFDPNAIAVTVDEEWINHDTGAVLAGAPTIGDGNEVSAIHGDRVALASEQLTVAAAAIGLAAIPASANHAIVHVWDADISLTLDGATTPTATVGTRQADGQTFELESRDEIDNFEAIRLAAVSARLNVQYYRVLDFANA